MISLYWFIRNPVLPSIDSLNEKSEEEFIHAINVLFEAAPPLADELYKNRPYKNYDELITKAEYITEKLSYEDRIIVINAHPRIGLNPNNELISALSYKEQGLDKEQKVNEEEKKEILETYEKLRKLNEKYEEKFGFKFVEFVAGRPKKDIVPVMEKRLNNESNEEIRTGIKAMMLIARDRLSKLWTQGFDIHLKKQNSCLNPMYH